MNAGAVLHHPASVGGTPPEKRGKFPRRTRVERGGLDEANEPSPPLGRGGRVAAGEGMRRSAAAAVLLASFALPATATAAYPDRPIRLIISSAAGGSPDVVTR